MEQLKQILEHEYLAELTKFNKLLNRDKSTEVLLPNELIIPNANDLIDTENLGLHPELLKYDKLYTSIEQSELLKVLQEEGNQQIVKKDIPISGFRLSF